MEKLFHTKWWDYSTYKMNINGRVCMRNSLLFGLMGMLAVHFVQPTVEEIIFQLNSALTINIATVLFLAFAADLLVTVRKLVDFNMTMTRLHEFSETLKDRYGDEEWFKKSSFTEMLQSLHEKMEADHSAFSKSMQERIVQFTERQKNLERFIRKFPSMRSEHYKEQISHIRHHLQELKKQKQL